MKKKVEATFILFENAAVFVRVCAFEEEGQPQPPARLPASPLPHTPKCSDHSQTA